MSFSLFCELCFLLSCCTLSATIAYYVGGKRGHVSGVARAMVDRIEEEERVDRMIQDSISLADTLDEPTIPRRFRHLKVHRWN